MADQHQELTQLLRSLNLSRMATTFEEVAVRAVRNGRSHEAFLYELARLECEHRAQRRSERRLRESGLPLEKTFRTLQLAAFGPRLGLLFVDVETEVGSLGVGDMRLIYPR